MVQQHGTQTCLTVVQASRIKRQQNIGIPRRRHQDGCHNSVHRCAGQKRYSVQAAPPPRRVRMRRGPVTTPRCRQPFLCRRRCDCLEPVLQILQQIARDRLYGNIKRCGWFAENNACGLQCHRARNSNRRFLPSRQMMRKPVQQVAGQTGQMRSQAPNSCVNGSYFKFSTATKFRLNH